jgi:hypothetical protein
LGRIGDAEWHVLVGVLARSVGLNNLALIAHNEEIIAGAALGSDDAIVRQIMTLGGGAATVGATNALNLGGNRFFFELGHDRNFPGEEARPGETERGEMRELPRGINLKRINLDCPGLGIKLKVVYLFPLKNPRFG